MYEAREGRTSVVWQCLFERKRLEAAGYRTQTWRVLPALQALLSATQLQGESAVAAPPFFPNAGRGTVQFRGNEQGPTVFLWDGWMKRGGRNANVQSRHDKIGLCGAERDQ